MLPSLSFLVFFTGSVGLDYQVDFFWSCDRYESRFAPFSFIVLTGPPGAKSWAKCLLAFLSAGSVGLPSSGRVAQHPALLVSVSPFGF